MKTNNKKSVVSVFKKASATRCVALMAGIIISVAGAASAQTFVPCPTIPGGTWSPSGNPYIISCNTTLSAGQTLTIQPGVVVEIGSGITLTINGTINAIGTPSQHVEFQAPVESQFWNTISITTPGVTSSFEFCDFQNATNALSLILNGGYTSQSATIYNDTFSNCVSAAISLYSAPNAACCSYANGTVYNNATIKNCIFAECGNGCSVYFSGVSLAGCGCGGDSTVYSTLIIENNIFENLTGTAFLMQIGNEAVYANPNFYNNTLVNCRNGVIGVDPINTTVENNIFVGCSNAMSDSGSLTRTVSYNCFYQNATNFTGYNNSIYGVPIITNTNGTPCDLVRNIYVNPLFSPTSNYYLQKNSPCIDAGTPDWNYTDLCITNGASQGTSLPDLGAYGGPDACNWLTTVPVLPTQLSMTKSNSLLWLTFGAIPRSTYQVYYIPTNFNSTAGTNRWLTNTTLIPSAKPVSIAVSAYPPTNKDTFYRVKSLGRVPGN